MNVHYYLYLLLSVSFIFYTDCWITSFANYQENESWVKIEAIILVSINNAFVNRITVVYLRVFLLGTNIIRSLSENETFRSSFSTKTVFFHTSLFLFHNPVTYCGANIQLTKWNCIAMLWKKELLSTQRPRRPPNWITHCCYQIMSRERKLVQRLVNDLFWSRLSNLITIPDCLIFGRSETQYVAMVTELFSSYCVAHLVESWCKESNTSDTNWLRYLSS